MLEIEAHESGPLGLEVAAHALVGRQKIPVKKRRLDLLAVAPSRRRRLQYFEPVEPGQHHVEDDELVRPGERPFEAALAVGDAFGLVTEVVEVEGDEFGEAGIVFDDEDFLAHI